MERLTRLEVDMVAVTDAMETKDKRFRDLEEAVAVGEEEIHVDGGLGVSYSIRSTQYSGERNEAWLYLNDERMQDRLLWLGGRCSLDGIQDIVPQTGDRGLRHPQEWSLLHHLVALVLSAGST